MSSSKYQALITKLLKNTRAKKIDWQPTDSGGVFQASFPGYSVRLDMKRDDYFLSLYNEWGEFVDSMSDAQLHHDYQGAYDAMKELYELARRDAMGVDEALDTILGQLTDDD